MEKYDVNFSRFAYEDLEEIFKYIRINQNDLRKAKDIYKKIVDESSKLEFFPKRNPIVNIKNNLYSNIRMYVVNNYMLFYTIDEWEKSVRIEKIFHRGADWMKNI